MNDEDKINEIKSSLSNWSFGAEDNVPTELYDLRSKCIYIISIVDTFLDVLIGMGATFKVKDKLDYEERYDIANLIIETVVSPINFDRKLQFAIKMEQLNEPLINYIKKACYLRNVLAHPFAPKYRKRIEELKTKSEQLKEWENLEKLCTELNNKNFGKNG